MRDTFAGIRFVRIAPGSFRRGLTPAEVAQLKREDRWRATFVEESPARTIRLTRGFWIAERELTQAQWSAHLPNPSVFVDPNRPVDSVTWDAAQELLKRLGPKFRLPTEAEWEWAARAGDASLGPAPVEKRAWHFGNAQNRTQPTGQLAPNAWGLYDTLGNVWEWTQDAYARDFYARSRADDPLCQDPGATERVLRGGCWGIDARFLRYGLRGGHLPSFKGPYVGLRVVRDLD